MNKLDFSKVDWRFVARILNENSLRLSRTRHGVSDTSTSKVKQPLLFSGADLKERSRLNEERAQQYIFNQRLASPPASGADVKDILFAIADITNDGLLPRGRFRTWPIDAKPPSVSETGPAAAPQKAKLPPELIPEQLDAYCDQIFQRWPELAADPVPLAAWAEWELNGGSLHPFYDGCGRISRLFSAWLLLCGSSMLPLFENMKSYFEQGHQGESSFCQYYRHRIQACREWLDGPST